MRFMYVGAEIAMRCLRLFWGDEVESVMVGRWTSALKRALTREIVTCWLKAPLRIWRATMVGSRRIGGSGGGGGSLWSWRLKGDVNMSSPKAGGMVASLQPL